MFGVLDPRFEWLEVITSGLKWPKSRLFRTQKWPWIMTPFFTI